MLALRRILDRAMELGIADRVEIDPAKAVQDADCVMLCAPVGAFADLAARIGPHLAPGAVLTDVGSTKQSVIRDVGPLVPAGVHFVPAHPIAGTEHSGPDAGFAELFQGRWTLLTPVPGTDEAAIRKIEMLWQRCGAQTERMEPSHHDRVLAIVSHLPHLIAFTICGTADDLADESRQEVVNFAASGFRTLPVSPPLTRLCGGIFSSTTERRCWRCCSVSWRTHKPWRVRFDGVTRRTSRTRWSAAARSGAV